MTLETAKTTNQEQWMLVAGDEGAIYQSPDNCQLVRFVRSGSSIFHDLNEALSDPANVLNVSAYPAVVKALEAAVAEIEHTHTEDLKANKNCKDCGCPSARIAQRGYTALSAVHPAEGDKG